MCPAESKIPLSDLRVVSLPEESLLEEVRPRVQGVECVLWDLVSEPRGCAPEDIDVAVGPFYGSHWMKDLSVLEPVGLLQLQSTGYDHVLGGLPESVALAGAGTVHAPGTAEVAVGLVVMAQRRLDRAVLQQSRGEYERYFTGSVADSLVTVLGVGGIGSAVVDRLRPFEAQVTRVGISARTDEQGEVHGIDELAELLPETDVLVLALPMSARTAKLVDSRLLSLLPDDALVVNVGRGATVDTDALTREVTAGRLRCALDVVDPEPLPGDHPLMSAEGAIVLPHIGGSNSSVRPRIRDLVVEQVERMQAGRIPRFLVSPGRLQLPAEDVDFS